MQTNAVPFQPKMGPNTGGMSLFGAQSQSNAQQPTGSITDMID